VPVKSQLWTTGWQVIPSPVKPELHAQVNAPAVLAQVALAPQLLAPVVHSLTSLQVTPLPE
jgi:hypothetical protein